MAMVYCRGCGKEIHETAPSCPHCGYVQSHAVTSNSSDSIWMVSLISVFALLIFLNWFGIETWDKNIKNGLWMFSITILILGTINIQQKRKGFVLSVISLIIAVVTILILMSKM
jgi:hypothetical protein